MSPLDGITLQGLRRTRGLIDTGFFRAYSSLVSSGVLDEAALRSLLTFAIFFLRADDPDLNEYGYAILVRYGARTGDWQPLRDVAATKDLAPIVEAVQRGPSPDLAETGYLTLLLEAHRQNFRVERNGGVSYRTHGQMALRSYASRANNVVIVAPTSYGKSEMLAERVAANVDRRVVVLVPTKALIAQTRRSLVRSPDIRAARRRLIVHPDEYTPDLTSFIAVMTQERLFRLLQENASLAVDLLLVDEAHNLLRPDSRASHLAQAIITALYRNPGAEIAYFTPFVEKAQDLEIVTTGRNLRGHTADEYVKAERLHFTRLGEGRRYIFDQFLGRTLEGSTEVPTDEYSAVTQLAGRKNISYVNRPRHAEELALGLARSLPVSESPDLAGASTAIAELIHPRYNLAYCVQHGVLFHHGSVPESVRQYVEELFTKRDPGSARYLVATSTLLEGVNTPADTLFLHSPSRGRGYLTAAAFRNLIGRVGRFNDIFNPDDGSLLGLQPNVYVLDGAYAPSRFNPESFLKRVADRLKEPTDAVENPLLLAADPSVARSDLLVALDNAEPGASGLPDVRRVVTRFGRLAFQNRISDVDIFDTEREIQRRLDQLVRGGTVLRDPGAVVSTVVDVFLRGFDLLDADGLARLRDHSSAERFYRMFLDWRSRALPYRRMVRRFLDFWKREDVSLIYVGSTWGDRTFGDGPYREVYVDVREKSEAQLVNLAIAKIKEEHDFVDFRLMPYVEILSDFGLLSERLYDRLKYGTDDVFMVQLLRQGFSLELARMLRDVYRDYVSSVSGRLEVSPDLVAAMSDAGENEVLVYEASCLV